jgi:hypothetical protein
MAPGGIWEYYDGRQIDAVEKVAHASERFGLTEIALKYRSGMSEWNKPSRCRALDRWIQEHLKDLESSIFGLIAKDRECLYPKS